MMTNARKERETDRRESYVITFLIIIQTLERMHETQGCHVLR